MSQLTLTHIKGIGDATAATLVQAGFASAEALAAAAIETIASVPGFGPARAAAVRQAAAVLVAEASTSTEPQKPISKPTTKAAISLEPTASDEVIKETPEAAPTLSPVSKKTHSIKDKKRKMAKSQSSDQKKTDKKAAAKADKKKADKKAAAKADKKKADKKATAKADKKKADKKAAAKADKKKADKKAAAKADKKKADKKATAKADKKKADKAKGRDKKK